MASFRLHFSRLTCNNTRIEGKINVKPTDLLKIIIHIHNRHQNQHGPNRFPCFLFPSKPFKTFFNQDEGQDFLYTRLSGCEFFDDDLLEVVVPHILSLSQSICQLDQDDPGIQVTKPSDSEPRVYHMELMAEFRQRRSHDIGAQHMNGVIEESMQQVRMTPASKAAIQELLKKPEVLKQEDLCVICMQDFETDDEEELKDVSALPCDHVFHTDCIVHWLHMNHMCPLCRFALPTVNNQETI